MLTCWYVNMMINWNNEVLKCWMAEMKKCLKQESLKLWNFYMMKQINHESLALICSYSFTIMISIGYAVSSTLKGCALMMSC